MLYLIDPHSDKEPELLADPAGLFSWSPDGSKIVYSDFEGLYILNLKNNSTTLLIDTKTTSIAEFGPRDFYTPVWSPDGALIAFAYASVVYDSTEEDISDIFLISPDGNDLRKFTTQPGFYTDTSWSPDSSQLIYTSWIGDDHGNIYRIDIDGNNLVQLTDSSGYSGRSDWGLTAAPPDIEIVQPPSAPLLPTSAPLLPLAGEPFALPTTQITVDNLDQLTPIARLYQGDFTGDVSTTHSRDGNTAVINSASGIFLLDIVTGDLSYLASDYKAVAISEHGHYILLEKLVWIDDMGETSFFYIWDTQQEAIISELEPNMTFYTMTDSTINLAAADQFVFSEDETTLYGTRYEDNYQWLVEGGYLISEHVDPQRVPTEMPLERLTGGDDTLKISGGENSHEFTIGKDVDQLSTNGETIVVSNHDYLAIYQFPTGELIKEFPISSSHFSASPDGRYIASVDETPVFSIWDVVENKHIDIPTDIFSNELFLPVLAGDTPFALSENHQYLFVDVYISVAYPVFDLPPKEFLDRDTGFGVFDLVNGGQSYYFGDFDSGVDDLTISSDGKYLIAKIISGGDSDSHNPEIPPNTVFAVNIENMSSSTQNYNPLRYTTEISTLGEKTFQSQKIANSDYRTAYDPNNQLLAIVAGNTVQIWSLVSNELVMEYTDDTIAHTNTLFIQNGEILLAGQYAIDVNTGNVLAEYNLDSDYWGNDDMALSPDGTTMLTLHEGVITYWGIP